MERGHALTSCLRPRSKSGDRRFHDLKALARSSVAGTRNSPYCLQSIAIGSCETPSDNMTNRRSCSGSERPLRLFQIEGKYGGPHGCEQPCNLRVETDDPRCF